MKVDENYLKILDEVKGTSLRCGRNPDDITLIAVTKTHAFDEIRPLLTAGCQDLGESRVQEALEKIELAPDNINWHLIGTLQKNKVNKAIGKFKLIHSVDSFELAEKISMASKKENLKTHILIQVNTSGEQSKQGFAPFEFEKNLDEIQKLENIVVEGLMTMAPFEAPEKEIAACFSKLRILRDKYGLKHLSMGMTHDFHIAIEEGATLLRIGTALFT